MTSDFGGGKPRYGRLEGTRVYRGAPRSLEPRLAKDAIGAALAFRGIANDVRAERLLAEWTDFVGAKIAARTRPEGITDRVLVIEVVSSAWLQELNMLRAQILAGLLERVGQPRLFDELRFKIAGRSRRADVIRPRPRAGVAPPPPFTPPATGLAREQIVREVESVDDEELRDLIARVRIANDR
jgi:predicted nucleic acid-binding Zn ribbon protein